MQPSAQQSGRVPPSGISLTFVRDLRDAVGNTATSPVSVGASRLPFEAGAWLRVLGDSQGTVAAILAGALRSQPRG